jgi:nucleoside-diphosphate-sugar epimerase
MAIVWPRVFYTYGPYEAHRRLVPSVVTALMRGNSVSTTAGEQVLDYLHVADVARAVWALAVGDSVGACNVASGRGTRVRDLVTEIASIVGGTELLRVGELPYRPDEPMIVVGDVARLNSTVNWSPRFGLSAGLRDAIEWWRSHQDAKAEPTGGLDH